MQAHSHSHTPPSAGAAGHAHTHAEHPAHPHPPNAQTTAPHPRAGLLMNGAAQRLLGALALVALLWLAVAWAVAD